MEITDGNIVVIRDANVIRGVFYRNCYDEIGDFFDEVSVFIFSKKLEEPNVSYMKVIANRFVPLSYEKDGDFYIEWNTFAKLWQTGEQPYCNVCKTPNFIFINKPLSYCPVCKK